mgnify:CR=1 FL=1
MGFDPEILNPSDHFLIVDFETGLTGSTNESKPRGFNLTRKRDFQIVAWAAAIYEVFACTDAFRLECYPIRIGDAQIKNTRLNDAIFAYCQFRAINKEFFVINGTGDADRIASCGFDIVGVGLVFTYRDGFGDSKIALQGKTDSNG